jgi:hypothetical protein
MVKYLIEFFLDVKEYVKSSKGILFHLSIVTPININVIER